MPTPLETARQALLERLGVREAPQRFDEALTHSSYANEHRGKRLADNQRLEFLGDGVLDLCVSELLLERLSEADEGVLSRAYGALVNGESLARWARDNDVGAALRVGRGAASTGITERSNVLADTVEAIIAAIYLDGGMDEARRVCALIVGDAIAHLPELSRRDAKTALQELVQARGAIAPAYQVMHIDGPDHDRTFTVAVLISGRAIAEGRGRSKKLAEQAAASAALELAATGDICAPADVSGGDADTAEGAPGAEST